MRTIIHDQEVQQGCSNIFSWPLDKTLISRVASVLIGHHKMLQVQTRKLFMLSYLGFPFPKFYPKEMSMRVGKVCKKSKTKLVDVLIHP